MTENGNETRPVRTLTVRNFSVIKDATLEFGKITVLIGPQASGKSLLCKLAYFLSRTVVERTEGFVEIGRSFSSFEDEVRKEFDRWFPSKGWGDQIWKVEYTSGKYQVAVSSEGGLSSKPEIAFCSQFKRLYEDHLNGPNPVGSAMAFRGIAGKGVWDSITYILAERNYFVDTLRDYKPLVSDPNEIVQAFAMRYKASLDPKIPKPRITRSLGGKLVHGKEALEFAFDDGRVLPLNELSAGHKELLPLLSILEMYEAQRPATVQGIQAGIDRQEWFSFDDIFVEEPEGHIFPDMQRELVQYFAEMVNSEFLRPQFTITTHSPYILSAFNNLIEASQVVAAKPELEGEVAKLIPERYWVKSNDVKAYCIRDGNLESIMDEETGLISGNYLDSVSETIGVEFDELLRLGYVES